MKNFIVQNAQDDILYPMTNKLQTHLECIKQNVQINQYCISGYLSVSDKTSLKRRQILCNMIDWMASTNTGRKILTMIPEAVQIYALSKCNKKGGDNFGESYSSEYCIVLNPSLLYSDMQGECVDTLAHEMVHVINYTLKRHVLKTTYNNLNPYDEFCLSFFDEVSAHICGAKVVGECINKPNKPISVANIMTNKMYWHWHYGNMLYQLTNYRRPFRQTKAVHTPSYYKLWQAYFDIYPELKWPELVRCIQLGGKKFMHPIRKDMQIHRIEPRGQKLMNRYYPLLRRLRVQMSRGKE